MAQAQAGKVWRTLKAGVTGARGAYSITVLPTDPGVFQWRVGTRVNGKVTASSAPFEVTALRWYYLSELPEVSGYAGSGAVRMNGTTYAKSVSNYYSGAVYGSGAIEYELRRACTKLRTTAGIFDNADSKTRTQLNILADGASLFSQEFGLGQAADVDLSIDEHLRLRLEWVTVVRGGASAFGDARILCAFRL